MDTRDIYKLVRELSEERDDVINLHDSMDIELNEGFVIETGVVGFTEDGVIVHLDEDAMEFLDFNGVLLESEELNESHDESPAYGATLGRIMRMHTDLLSKYGPAAVMAAVEDVTGHLTDLEEIGSSDVSIWVREVIKDLEAGHYKDLHEDSEADVDSFKAKVAASEDAFDMIYDAISGNYGEEIRKAIQEMYDDVVIDSQGRLHPDDDFEEIIGRVVDHIDAESGDMSLSNDHAAMRDIMWHPGKIDELAAIKKLALGESWAHSDHNDPRYDDDSTDPSVSARDKARAQARRRAEDDGWGTDDERENDAELDEGLGKMLLGGAALIAALTGINKYEASQMMKNDPQLAKLAHFREVAQQKGDDAKVQELDDRIKTTMDHLTVTGDEVRDEMGRPIDPVYEAEYQGRKVPLGKPMQGDVKKSKVYVRKPNGKVVKVNFGDKNMRIKKNSPGHRKSFRARHHCENPGPRWKARYWSCRAW